MVKLLTPFEVGYGGGEDWWGDKSLLGTEGILRHSALPKFMTDRTLLGERQGQANISRAMGTLLGSENGSFIKVVPPKFEKSSNTEEDKSKEAA